MTFRGKGFLIGIALVAFGGGAIGAVMHQRATRYPQVSVEGINELKLQLEIPGGGKNPGDFVIRNAGEHTLVAYRVVYEAHSKSGEVHEWSKTVVQPLAFLGSEDRDRFLSPTYSCIPPGTAVFGGLLRESMPQDGKNIPKLERVWVPRGGLESYDRIDVRLDAVMLEDGQIHGRNKGALMGGIRQSFGDEVREFLKRPEPASDMSGGDDAKD
ncbi:MAG TPA: hypothetical protein VF591_22540 [Pyrinomonadaceae bacterium]